ncbi:unnamed protein product [Ascophyllum nodosum]
MSDAKAITARDPKGTWTAGGSREGNYGRGLQIRYETRGEFSIKDGSDWDAH